LKVSLRTLYIFFHPSNTQIFLKICSEVLYNWIRTILVWSSTHGRIRQLLEAHKLRKFLFPPPTFLFHSSSTQKISENMFWSFSSVNFSISKIYTKKKSENIPQIFLRIKGVKKKRWGGKINYHKLLQGQHLQIHSFDFKWCTWFYYY
jgi:hypothetical protein